MVATLSATRAALSEAEDSNKTHLDHELGDKWWSISRAGKNTLVRYGPC